jgi:hypothetical protein
MTTQLYWLLVPVNTIAEGGVARVPYSLHHFLDCAQSRDKTDCVHCDRPRLQPRHLFIHLRLLSQPIHPLSIIILQVCVRCSVCTGSVHRPGRCMAHEETTKWRDSGFIFIAKGRKGDAL